MRNNLTKKEIAFVSAKELNYRYCHLLHKAETMPAGVITLTDAREVLMIEEELHKRLIKLIGHDFYPPERPAKPTIAKLRSTTKKRFIKAIPKPLLKKEELKVDIENKLRFKITIISRIRTQESYIQNLLIEATVLQDIY